MYLKSIKAYGFKSFADKTEITFTNGITGIVGPNGSGKSNVVDAIRWVLGEQSIKSLRGEGSMTDVIFAGSKSRNGEKRASVSLCFDNSDHYLNSDFTEIEIKRVVYLTGENEYLINNAKVRLKDITDLFMDSGVDKEAFNIISQGEVANIVNSKPIDRRSIFESAASVLKYKKRKDESIRKLDKTKDNLSRIKMLIDELEQTVLPLEEQAIKAKKYNELKDKLKEVEVALMVNDIKRINENYKNNKNDLEILQKELDKINVSTDSNNALIEELKLQRLQLEETINIMNGEIISINNEISEIDTEKRLNVEREKMSANSNIDANALNLKETVLNLEKNIAVLQNNFSELKDKDDSYKSKLTNIKSEISEFKIKESTATNKYNSVNEELQNIKNQIIISQNNIEKDAFLPLPVKSILNNPRLNVCGVFGKLISYDNTYLTALECAIGYNYNVIVVDNELVAKTCIDYLKTNNLGRSTFFPINQIKPRYVDSSLIERLKGVNGFIGIASDLVKTDTKYQNVILNQLGNVLVVKDIDALNLIGNITNHAYRIVTLDGEIAHTGGSITGGSIKNNHSTFLEKLNLEKLMTQEIEINNNIKSILNEIKELNNLSLLAKEKEEKTLRELFSNQELMRNIEQSIKDYNYQLQVKKSELLGIENISNNKVSELIDNLLTKYYEKITIRDNLVHKQEVCKNQLSELVEKINETELHEKNRNSHYNKLMSDIKNYELSIAKMDVQLDNLLLALNENYSLTYERALNEYELSMDEPSARKKVHYYRLEIKDLGDVNTGSIAEYDRLKVRYDFLKKQELDLVNGVDSLLGVISEMDEIMKDKFLTTFNKIKNEFSTVYKTLFKGGEGTLKLTDPDNILETGIEILAIPPGKKISSNTLLSGGEKTLTAIALLFAILNVKKAPFCVLDEVEAALDEANVDMFGNFLKLKKDASQFIIITHKKRTMEYADYLYGITMQESGVSKLVSVKLNNIE